MSTAAVELSVIAAARWTDQHCDINDGFEADVVAALNGGSVRRIASIVAEMAGWLEHEGYLLVWDAGTNLYAVQAEPEGYISPADGPVVAGPYGKQGVHRVNTRHA